MKHVCTLPTAERGYRRQLTRTTSARLHGQRLRKYTILSEKNPKTCHYFRSENARLMEKLRHLNSDFYYIIHPLSIFRMAWESYMFFVFFFSLIAIPLDSVECQNSIKTFDLLATIVTILDILCILDIVMTFYTGYENQETKQIIICPKQIRKRYSRSTYFAMDILSSIPMEVVQACLSPMVANEHIYFIKIISLLKVVRVRTLLIYMQNMANIIKLNMKILIILRCIIMAILILHWTACLHFIISCHGVSRNHAVDRSWINQAMDRHEKNPYKIYLECIFRSVTLFMGVSHDLIFISSNLGAIVTWVTVICALICNGLVVIIIKERFMEACVPRIKYMTNMDQLNEYMNNKRLTPNLQKRLVQYFQYRYRGTYFKESAVTTTLSKRIIDDVNVYCCRSLIQGTILNDLPPLIIRDIIKHMKEELYLPNDVIIKAGTKGTCMYFLSRGTVSVLTPGGKEVCHLQDNDYFGEISLVYPMMRRTADVVAIEFCKVFRIDKKIFSTRLMNDLDIYLKIEMTAHMRMKLTEELEEVHKMGILEKLTHLTTMP